MRPFSNLKRTGLALAISNSICLSAQAATLMVSTDSDSLEIDAGVECTLRKAVASVNERDLKPGCVNTGAAFGVSDTIIVDPALADQSIVLAGEQLPIGLDGGDPVALTIQGNGVTIDGDAKSRVLQVRAGNSLSIDSVTITRGSTVGNGDDNSNGAGIELKGGTTLTMSNSTLSNNTARRRGGAISASSLSGELKPTATLTNTTLSQNASQFNDGGAIHFSDADLTLENVVIENNTATGSTAGGAGAYLRDGRFQLNRVSISGNQAGTATGRSSSGAGLNFRGREGDQLTITNSTVSTNTAFGSAGGIRIRAYGSALVEIANTTISGNSAINNTYATGGGVSVVGDGTVLFRNSTIVNNTASDDTLAVTTSGIVLSRFNPEVILQNTIIASPSGAAACEIDTGTLVSNADSIIFGGGCSNNARNVNPRLGPLTDNGGPTLTHLPLSGSPAVNTGNNAQCEANDQRGITRARSNSDRCDVGAVELEGQEETTFFVVPTKNAKTVIFEL